MRKIMKDWFFMRPEFDTFSLEPDTHCRYLFGEADRKQRNLLLGSLEEAAFSQDGHKATIYGDYGRGKTHQCHNIVSEIKRRELPFIPVYIKCGAYTKKEPFASFFSAIVTNHPSELTKEIARKYQDLVSDGKAKPILETVKSEDIANVIEDTLTSSNLGSVRLGMRWLGGEAKLNLGGLPEGIRPELRDSGDFGAVMKGLSTLFITVLDKVPLYIVDEAERFQNITDTDTYFGWLAALRELTEIRRVAILFMIGARTRDFLPTIFSQDEIIRRIGVVNYIEFYNPGPQDLRSFIVEQLQTSILKGEVPESQSEVMDPESTVTAIPPELLEITGGDPVALSTYPFEPDAFDEFVSQVSGSDYSNKPSEAQIRLQKAASRAMRYDKRLIDSAIVEEIANEGF